MGVVRIAECQVNIHVSDEVDKRWCCFKPFVSIVRYSLKMAHATHRDTSYQLDIYFLS